MRRCDHPNRRGLLAAGTVAALGAVATGCGPRRRPPSYQPIPAPEPGAPPPAPTLPAEPGEGRLVSGHFAALGMAGSIEEPLAPPGAWQPVWDVQQGGEVHFWRPAYLPEDVFRAIVLEVCSTPPRWEVDQPALPGGPGPRVGTRVILCPGPALASGRQLVAELFAAAAWDDRTSADEAPGTRSDVLWLGLTDRATRSAVPAGHAYQLYAPGTGHGLAHQYHDRDGDHRERAGRPCCEVLA